MPSVKNHLRGDVLRSATQGICPIPGFKPLDEAKISELDIAIILDKHIFWLQVSVDQVLAVHELKDQNDLGGVESCIGTRHRPCLFQHI